METINMTELRSCHICTKELEKHPLYPDTVARTCRRHGDFFIYHARGNEPKVVFKKFQSNPRKKAVTKDVTSVPTKKEQFAEQRSRAQEIRCDQTGRIYPSLTNAAVMLGIWQSDISKHLEGLRPTVGGYTFTRMVDDGLGNLIAVPRPKLPKDRSREKTPIRCDQTGVVYDSIREAARELGINRGNFYAYFRGDKNRPRIGGYTFTKV